MKVERIDLNKCNISDELAQDKNGKVKRNLCSLTVDQDEHWPTDLMYKKEGHCSLPSDALKYQKMPEKVNQPGCRAFR